MLKNDRLLRALHRLSVDRTPIWMMRQAGRYLPEYREMRQKSRDFVEFCQTPTMATEATLQPLRRYELDAAILFSDILVLPHAMGATVRFAQGEGPVFDSPIRSMAAVDALKMPDPTKDLDYVLEAIERILDGLDNSVPLIGFCGSPLTVASYLVEGSGSKQFAVLKRLAYETPEVLERLLDKLAKASAEYLIAQVAAGVHAVMIFDTWGAMGSLDFYQRWSQAPMQKMIQMLRESPISAKTPIITFTKGAGLWLPEQLALQSDAYGVDWTMDLGAARKIVGNQAAIQGNLDPAVLYGSHESIVEAVKKVLADYGTGPGHIFNLGHGILPDIDPDKVMTMIKAVHSYSAQYHPQMSKDNAI